ncbi:hypothetical protein [Variovorax paradoxus]|uniref:hypothetical protein n=1 Tax=Variovorax paradoxus TaxID=34073 RepID=UPI000782569C|nr:hypothetical protein [Variovorax paradoxus]
MSRFTKITRNQAWHSMRAMALCAMEGMQWRHHGIGVLQGYLGEGSDVETRLHIWSRRLLKPGMDISGDAHDHRFHMVSHVLCGTIAHEELSTYRYEGGDHRMMALTHARAAADNKFHGPTTALDGAFRVVRHLMRIEAGESYTFPAQHFHRSPLLGGLDDVAVTVIEKHQQQDVPARILYPAAHPPVMAFGHDMDSGLIASVLALARTALSDCGAGAKGSEHG